MDARLADREPGLKPTEPQPTVAARFAAFTAGLTLEQVPPALVHKAKLRMLDALGTALAASVFDFAAPLLEGARKLGRGDEAHALASGAALPAAGGGAGQRRADPRPRLRRHPH